MWLTALFWFRYTALATVVTGLLMAFMSSYLVNALSLQRPARAIGMGDGGSAKRWLVRLEFEIPMKSKLRTAQHWLDRPKRAADSPEAFMQVAYRLPTET